MSTAAGPSLKQYFEDFTSVLNFKGKSQRVTKVRLQPDREAKLAHDSCSHRLCRCAEFIFPCPCSVAALRLLNSSALLSTFDSFFTCATHLKRLSHSHNLFELPPANFLVLGTFSAIPN